MEISLDPRGSVKELERERVGATLPACGRQGRHLQERLKPPLPIIPRISDGL
jgi:hypothetical protein